MQILLGVKGCAKFYEIMFCYVRISMALNLSIGGINYKE